MLKIVLAVLLLATIVLGGNTPFYYVNEALSQNKCKTDNDCDGLRTCDTA